MIFRGKTKNINEKWRKWRKGEQNGEKTNLKSVSNNKGVKTDKLKSKTFSISEQIGKLNEEEDVEINVIKNNTNCHFDALDLQKCWATIIDEYKSKQKNTRTTLALMKTTSKIFTFVYKLILEL